MTQYTSVPHRLRMASAGRWFAALALLGTSVIGGGAFAADTWSSDLQIAHIAGDTNVSVYMTGSVPNPASCSQGPLNAVSWASSDPAAKNYMAMMLTAKVSGRPVQVLIDGTNCLWSGWPKLLSMKLK